MKAINVSDVAPIHRRRYWDVIKGDELAKGHT
ncbi:hypothetical protein [Devosia rhizoryzae]|nr:hypothetical protein [Devosia rhizoryzae]